MEVHNARGMGLPGPHITSDMGVRGPHIAFTPAPCICMWNSHTFAIGPIAVSGESCSRRASKPNMLRNYSAPKPYIYPPSDLKLAPVCSMILYYYTDYGELVTINTNLRCTYSGNPYSCIKRDVVTLEALDLRCQTATCNYTAMT